MNTIHSALLIDKDPVSNFYNERIILKLQKSVKVMIALNAREAISWILQGNCPNLILMDIETPLLESFEFLRTLNDHYSICKEKIIIAILSSSSHFEDRRKIQKFGINHHIIKPLTELKLMRLLAAIRLNIT